MNRHTMTRTLSLVLTLAFLAPALGAARDAKPKAKASPAGDTTRERRATFRRADRQLLAWATERARETLTPVLESKATDAAAKLLEGRLLEQEGHFEKAARAFQAAADASPRSAEAHLYLGAYHARAERAERAAAHYTAAFKRATKETVREPESAAAYALLGRTAQALDRLGEAVAAYQKALELAPNDPIPALYLGTIRYRQGRYSAALELLERVLADHTYVAHAYFYRGITYSKLGRKPEMIADLDRFVAMAPNAPEADTARAILGAVR